MNVWKSYFNLLQTVPNFLLAGMLDDGLADLEGFDQVLQPHQIKSEPTVPRSPSTEVETSMTHLKISTTTGSQGQLQGKVGQRVEQGNVFQNRKGFQCPTLNLAGVDGLDFQDFKMSPSAADFGFSPTANMPLSPATLNK
jgi:hypothetical protein